MKVKAVNPGRVYPSEIDGEWAYVYRRETDAGTQHVTGTGYATAHAAKQAMRECVAHERNKHMVE
jgi:hypothetical protein